MRNKTIYTCLLGLLIFAQTSAQEFVLGADLSYVNELEDCGAVYYDQDGMEGDPYTILADKGANLVRLRLWHSPDWTDYSNFADVKKSMSRAKANGMSVMLDFHYSDFWADPSRQWRPAAWNSLTLDESLADSVYRYTYETLERLVDADLTPAIVQIGNEINGNMLIKRTTQDIDGSSPGMSPINWSRMILFLHKGIAAVKQINADYGTSIKSLIHVAQPENALWWFQYAHSNGLTGYDIIGISYYPQWSDYDIHDVADHVAHMVATYGKEFMIVETGYPWTTSNNDWASNVIGYDSKEAAYEMKISKEVQRDFLTELTYLVKANGGNGVVYWEPAWVSSDCQTYWATGSHYDNATLFDFDNKLHIGADYLSYDYSVKPATLMDQEVVFKVNMKGVNTDNGVYVTGDFTGKEWQFMPMYNQEGDWYLYETVIPGRSAGAFIFYNNNTWNDTYRESVPSACAEYWNTHRKFLVLDEPVSYEYAWSSCSSIPDGVETKQQVFKYRYLPDQEIIMLDVVSKDSQLVITNISGQLIEPDFISHNSIDVSMLPAGVYFLSDMQSAGKSGYKFLRF